MGCFRAHPECLTISHLNRGRPEKGKKMGGAKRRTQQWTAPRAIQVNLGSHSRPFAVPKKTKLTHDVTNSPNQTASGRQDAGRMPAVPGCGSIAAAVHFRRPKSLVSESPLGGGRLWAARRLPPVDRIARAI